MRLARIIITTEVILSASGYIEDELWLGFLSSVCERVKDSVGASRGVCNAELVSSTFRHATRVAQHRSDNLKAGVLKAQSEQRKKKKTRPSTRRATLFKK